MKSVEIDRTKSLIEEPATGHNRLHPSIPPILEVEEGEEVVLQTRDGVDGQLGPSATAADIPNVDPGAVHPLTGPVFVKGALPGDLLEVEFLDVVPEPTGFTGIMPGLGLLRDVFTTPYLVQWSMAEGWATAPQLPGVRVPGAPFMGVSVVAPSLDQVNRWAERERRVVEQGFFAMVADPNGAVPGSGPAATEGLRTLPPRENGGNFDIKQLTKGSKLLLPVAVEGALFSVGDGHFAQGDGEVCVTAIEMSATAAVRFRLLKGEASRHNIRGPRFVLQDYFTDPRWAVPRRFVATIGIPVTEDGVNEAENLTLACKNALLRMIELLQERGWSAEQAYVLCSVAADLRIGNVVDVPNYAVSALLPEDIFQG